MDPADEDRAIRIFTAVSPGIDASHVVGRSLRGIAVVRRDLHVRGLAVSGLCRLWRTHFQFATHDAHLRGRFDSNSDGIPTHPHQRDLDVLADHDLFLGFSR
jgi:hypothetical protein